MNVTFDVSKLRVVAMSFQDASERIEGAVCQLPEKSWEHR